MDRPRFDPAELVHAARDSLTVGRVFGEAYERDGTLVVPVARVTGASGVGAGGGEAPGGDGGRTGSGDGGGGGFGLRVVPLGVLVVDGRGAHWHPTFDLNRAVLGGQLVAGGVLVTALVTQAVVRVLRRR